MSTDYQHTTDDLAALLEMEDMTELAHCDCCDSSSDQFTIVDGLCEQCLSYHKAHLDSDRKMKAELAERLTEARRLMGYVPFWAKMATQAEVAPDARTLGSEVNSRCPNRKARAADSKTEASE